MYSLSLDKTIFNMKIVSNENNILEEIHRRLGKYDFYHTNIEVLKNEFDIDDCYNFHDL